MGFLFGRRALNDDELREELFAAAASGDSRALGKVLERELPRVVELFPRWSVIPESVRSDPDNLKFWAQGLIAVASMGVSLGERSMMDRLMPPGGNQLTQWQDALVAAEAEAGKGNYASAIARLERALAESEGMVGSGRDDLLPKTYGLLGTLCYHAGRMSDARKWTVKAKEFCDTIGDREGSEIYAKNLAVLDNRR